jgi:SAM-dependent methyltransferase
MSIFEAYANYYDLMYSDKDYGSESKFVHNILQQHAPGATSILDFGCGTGSHALRFAEMGYATQGVDLSGPMISVARRRQEQLTCEIRQRLNFIQGDIRSSRLDARYDAVVCLFHVLSYQITDRDVKMALDTVAHHISSRGVCLFDFWYGPAVLSSPPAVRLKRLQDGSLSMLRISEPTLRPNENVVDVDYLFFVQEKATGHVAREFRESHRLRYFFMPELLSLLEGAGLVSLQWGEWLTGNTPAANTWSVYILAKPTS